MGITQWSKMSVGVLLSSCVSLGFLSLVKGQCLTTGGQACVFPFKFGAVTFNSCTTAGGYAPWCSTKVDSNGVHVGGNFGDCSANCLTTTTTTQAPASSECTTTGGPAAGANCVFPFKYAGYTLDSCTTLGGNPSWCYTQVDSQGNGLRGTWADCPNTPACNGGSSTTTTTTTTTAAPSSSCRCGKANRATKIVGGQTTEENEYPWQVGLISSSRDKTPFCGGSLISDTEILTAAHCTQSGVSWVVLGEHSLSDDSDGQQRVRVCSVTDHPQYNAATTDYDFSILTLCDPVTFATDVAPVCLPSTSNYADDNVNAVVSGWGTLQSGGSQPNLLQDDTVQTMTNAQCRATGYSSSQITNQMICASNPGKDSCQGDSGGPLVTPDATTGAYTLIGVVSWGAGCAQNNYPGVYSRVEAQLSWIEQNTKGTTCPAA